LPVTGAPSGRCPVGGNRLIRPALAAGSRNLVGARLGARLLAGVSVGHGET
jgi:hypothetical protein